MTTELRVYQRLKEVEIAIAAVPQLCMSKPPTEKEIDANWEYRGMIKKILDGLQHSITYVTLLSYYSLKIKYCIPNSQRT